MSETKTKKTKTIHEQLSKIQKELKAPKGQVNKFGNYNYRSCEDILESVKPLLNGLVLTIHDEMIHLEGRFYVKATARLWDGENVCEASAYAREAENKKGMDSAQVTGATSSYARKYALNGLFAIDDTKDADTLDNSDAPTKPVASKKTTTKAPVKKTVAKPAGTPADTPTGKAAFEAGGKLICGCGREITPAVANFSERKYGKAICMVCQQKEGKGAAPEYENDY